MKAGFSPERFETASKEVNHETVSNIIKHAQSKRIVKARHKKAPPVRAGQSSSAGHGQFWSEAACAASEAEVAASRFTPNFASMAETVPAVMPLFAAAASADAAVA